MRMAAVLMAAALGACSRSEPGLDARVRTELMACAQALESAVHERGPGKLKALATGCSSACPRLGEHADAPYESAEDVTALLDDCHLFCSAEARDAWLRSRPEEQFAALIGECGPETYGLTPASAPLMSEVWLILLRVHEWLESHRGRADQALRQELERAGTHAHFALPLPARLDNMYVLPASSFGQPGHAALYVVIEQGGRVRAAALPVARIRPGELERRPVPGGEFPGAEITPLAREYADLVRLLEGIHPGSGHNAIDAKPLVLADAGTRVRRLMEVTAAIGQPRFVLGVAGRTALVHPVALRHLTAAGSAAPVLHVRPDELVVVGGEADLHIPRGQDANARLGAELSDLSIERAPQDEIEIVLGDTATVAELVSVLDVIAETKFQVALIRAEADH